MTDTEIIEFIKKNSKGTQLAYGTNSTIMAIWMPYNKEIKEWADKANEDRKAAEAK